jgi:hypothetical protein
MNGTKEKGIRFGPENLKVKAGVVYRILLKYVSNSFAGCKIYLTLDR